MNNKKIYILGAGAIGRSLAVFLKGSSGDVTLVRTSTDDYNTRVEDFTVDLNNGEQLTASIEVGSLRNFDTLDGIIVLANKAFANGALAQALRQKAGNSPVVIMQNGLDVEQPFIELDFPVVYRCVLFATSQIKGTHGVTFKPVQPSPIGIVKGAATDIHDIVTHLDNQYFRFTSVDDIQPLVWKKVIANCVFNSVCPLLDIDNGLFHRSEEAMLVAGRLIHECVSLAKEVGISLSEVDIQNMVLLISRSSDGQLISTLQDINSGRTTEIDNLNFSIARIADRIGKGHLVTETRLLGELTKLKSKLKQTAPST